MKNTLFTSLIFLVLFALCIVLYSQKQTEQLHPDSNAVPWTGAQKLEHDKKDSDSIEIAGIPSPLVFIADEKNQKVNFVNPSSNDCYIRFTLYVNNAPIWHSENVPPDAGYYNIVLEKTLEKGEYDAYLLNECFLSDGTQLNNAKVQFKLIVKEK